MLAQPSTTVLYLSPMRLIFNCYSEKNFRTNDRNILKTLPGLVLTCASLVRARAQRPLASSPWKTTPLFFLHTMCFLRVQRHFNSRRPTSLFSSPFFQPKIQCCHQPAFTQDSPEGGCDEVMWLLASLSLYKWIMLHAWNYKQGIGLGTVLRETSAALSRIFICDSLCICICLSLSTWPTCQVPKALPVTLFC